MSQLMAEEGLRLQQQENGIRLELNLTGKTAEEALEQAISTIQKVKATYRSQKQQGFGFDGESATTCETTSEAQKQMVEIEIPQRYLDLYEAISRLEGTTRALILGTTLISYAKSYDGRTLLEHWSNRAFEEGDPNFKLADF